MDMNLNDIPKRKGYATSYVNGVKLTAFPFLGLVDHIFWGESSGKKKAIISIHEAPKEDYGISFRPCRDVVDVLELNFSDIDTSYLEKEKEYLDNGTLALFTIEQAKQIVGFVKKNIAEVDEICVHCHLGVSRSTAVCAAISKYYTNDDMYWYKNGNPNTYVFITLLTEFMEGE